MFVFLCVFVGFFLIVCEQVCFMLVCVYVSVVTFGACLFLLLFFLMCISIWVYVWVFVCECMFLPVCVSCCICVCLFY